MTVKPEAAPWQTIGLLVETFSVGVGFTIITWLAKVVQLKVFSPMSEYNVEICGLSLMEAVVGEPVIEVQVYPVAPFAVKLTPSFLQITLLEGTIVIVGLGFVASWIVVVFTQVPSDAVTVYSVVTEGQTTGLAPVTVNTGGPAAVHV